MYQLVNWPTLLQFDPVLNKVQLDLQRLIYRYLTQSEIEQSGAGQRREELNISLMEKKIQDRISPHTMYVVHCPIK